MRKEEMGVRYCLKDPEPILKLDAINSGFAA